MAVLVNTQEWSGCRVGSGESTSTTPEGRDVIVVIDSLIGFLIAFCVREYKADLFDKVVYKVIILVSCRSRWGVWPASNIIIDYTTDTLYVNTLHFGQQFIESSG